MNAPSRLERHQVWIYLAAIAVGLALGSVVPGAGVLDGAVLPTVGVLIFATSTQVPLVHVPAVARDGRFLVAVLTGNFIVAPLIVWGIVSVVQPAPAVMVGIVLVLVVPCTDWFLSFSHLAGGDTPRAIASTPFLLVLQLLLLPVYLWLLVDTDVSSLIAAGHVVAVFFGLIVLPLVAAAVLQRVADRREAAASVLSGLGRAPVPLLATVVFLIAASQVSSVTAQVDLLPLLAAAFATYLVVAAVAGRVVAAALRLSPAATRTVVFSMGTRNSFVVLPIALALPVGAEVAIVVMVFQSLVELLGMTLYVRLVPRLVPDRPD